jgi:hypothetical protein
MVAKIAIFTPGEAIELDCCGANPRAPRKCISNRCMAWRWFETHLPDANGDLVKNGEVYGFCGLAGDPSPRRAA